MSEQQQKQGRRRPLWVWSDEEPSNSTEHSSWCDSSLSIDCLDYSVAQFLRVNRVKMIQLQNSLLKMGVEAKDALEGGMMEILKHPFSVAKGVKMFETVATSLTRMFDYYCKVKECLTICERSQLIHLIMLVNIVHRRLRKRSVSSEEHVWDWLFTISNDGAEGSWLRQYQARLRLMVCRMCEEYIPVMVVREHSQLCSEQMALKDRVIELRGVVKELLEEVKSEEMESIRQAKQAQQQQRRSNQKQMTNSPLMAPSASKGGGKSFLKRAKTVTVDDRNQIIAVGQDEGVEEVQRSIFQRSGTRQLTSKLQDPNNLRSALQTLKVVRSYCQRQLKEQSLSIENDVTTQSFLKISHEEMEEPRLQELVDRCLEIVQERISIWKKIHRVQLSLQQLVRPKKGVEQLKRQFQKGVSNSFKEKSRSISSLQSQKKRVMDGIRAPSQFKQFREDEVQMEERKKQFMGGVSIDSGHIGSTYTLDGEDGGVDLFNGWFSDSYIHSKSFKANREKFDIKSFEFLDVIGVGAYGAVWKVRKRLTNDIYAIKVIDTRKRQDKNLYRKLQMEKNVFAVIDGDFVVNAYYSFSYYDCLFFVQEYIRGGDFSKILYRFGALEEEVARFYLAELVLAIESLHRKSIIHRDLKPDNILLDSTGHIKLADFGLSELGLSRKINQNPRSTGIFGTPDYMAPEVLLGKSVSDPAIDWWSFGVLMYEFIVGLPPFNDQTPEKIFANILSGNVVYPEIGRGENMMTPEAYDLVSRLLTRDPEMRATAAEIKLHEFFRSVNWSTIRKSAAPIMAQEYDVEIVSSPLRAKKQAEVEKMKALLSSTAADEGDKFARLGVSVILTPIQQLDNLMRLDLLIQMNYRKAEELISNRRKKK